LRVDALTSLDERAARRSTLASLSRQKIPCRLPVETDGGCSTSIRHGYEGETDMFMLELAVVHYWSNRRPSHVVLEQVTDDGIGRVVLRLGLAFAVFALLIASLSWAEDPHRPSPQMVAATRM
jgi:hypothetical protein